MALMRAELDDLKAALVESDERVRSLERKVNEAEAKAYTDAERDRARTTARNIDDLNKDVASRMADKVGDGLGVVVDVYYDLKHIYEDAKEYFHPTGPHCGPAVPSSWFCPPPNQMCGPDYGINAWYETGGGRHARRLDRFDRMAHCLCKMMDAQYGQLTQVGGVPVSPACPYEPDRLKEECLTDPSGPNGAPRRPECLAYLKPGTFDADSWNAKICQAVQCPAFTFKFMKENGACECSPAPPEGGGGLPPCPNADFSLCYEEGGCGCLPLDSGSAPNGGLPGCQYNPAPDAFGGKDALVLRDPRDVFVNDFDNRRFMMIKSGNTPVGMPTLYKDSLPQMGTKLHVDTLLTVAPAQGESIDLQFYCSNREDNVNNLFSGQCRVSDQAAGVRGVCEVPLRPECFRSTKSTIEAVLNAPTSYKGRTGITQVRMAGFLTDTPPSRLLPICPRPAPDNTFGYVLYPNPSVVENNGTIYRFLTGTGTIPLLLNVPRELGPRTSL
jgi:hypothetical protein